MNKKYLILSLGMLGLIGMISEANAHDSLGFSLNIGGPAYYSPPVVYAPSPQVYYSAPPVVYYRPAPVYYTPAHTYGYQNEYDERHDHGRHRGWQRDDD